MSSGPQTRILEDLIKTACQTITGKKRSEVALYLGNLSQGYNNHIYNTITIISIFSYISHGPAASPSQTYFRQELPGLSEHFIFRALNANHSLPVKSVEN